MTWPSTIASSGQWATRPSSRPDRRTFAGGLDLGRGPRAPPDPARRRRCPGTRSRTRYRCVRVPAPAYGRRVILRDLDAVAEQLPEAAEGVDAGPVVPVPVVLLGAVEVVLPEAEQEAMVPAVADDGARSAAPRGPVRGARSTCGLAGLAALQPQLDGEARAGELDRGAGRDVRVGGCRRGAGRRGSGRAAARTGGRARSRGGRGVQTGGSTSCRYSQQRGCPGGPDRSRRARRRGRP
jgi:hypothetical protein